MHVLGNKEEAPVHPPYGRSGFAGYGKREAEAAAATTAMLVVEGSAPQTPLRVYCLLVKWSLRNQVAKIAGMITGDISLPDVSHKRTRRASGMFLNDFNASLDECILKL